VTRVIKHRYTDPLDLIWLKAAHDIGWQVLRDSSTYASFDGKDTLTIATPEDFDADDCLAQMILHEICHALIAGPDSAMVPDYGLENADDRDLIQEHATHRLQAHLAQRWGLRELFAVTTDWRPHWDRLPLHPLAAPNEPAAMMARAALARAKAAPFEAALRRAFAATRLIVSATLAAAPSDSLFQAARRAHPHSIGGIQGPDDETCGGCAWFQEKPSSDGSGACLMHAIGEESPPVTATQTTACVRWEPRLTESACIACGACCREAFQAVPVEDSSPLLRSHPDWIARDIEGFGPYLPRPLGRCVALSQHKAPWLCAVYEARPTSCRDFELNGPNCLEARQRVGLTPRTG